MTAGTQASPDLAGTTSPCPLRVASPQQSTCWANRPVHDKVCLPALCQLSGCGKPDGEASSSLRGGWARRREMASSRVSAARPERPTVGIQPPLPPAQPPRRRVGFLLCQPRFLRQHYTANTALLCMKHDGVPFLAGGGGRPLRFSRGKHYRALTLSRRRPFPLPHPEKKRAGFPF